MPCFTALHAKTTLFLPYPHSPSPSWASWSLPSLIFFDVVLKRRTSDPSNLKRATTVGGLLNLIFSLFWEIERRERTNKRIPSTAVAVNKRKQRAHQKEKRLLKDQWSQTRDYYRGKRKRHPSWFSTSSKCLWWRKHEIKHRAKSALIQHEDCKCECKEAFEGHHYTSCVLTLKLD